MARCLKCSAVIVISIHLLNSYKFVVLLPSKHCLWSSSLPLNLKICIPFERRHVRNSCISVSFFMSTIYGSSWEASERQSVRPIIGCLLWQGGWTQQSPMDPSNPNHPVILWCYNILPLCLSIIFSPAHFLDLVQLPGFILCLYKL